MKRNFKKVTEILLATYWQLLSFKYTFLAKQLCVGTIKTIKIEIYSVTQCLS